MLPPVFRSMSQGTPVYDVTGGQHRLLGITTDWSTKPADWSTQAPGTRPVGCPQWIDVINVAQTPEAARQATPLAKTLIASSSASSRNVTRQDLAPDGTVTGSAQVPYVLVPVSHTEVGPD